MSLILRRSQAPSPVAELATTMRRLNQWMDEAFNAWPFTEPAWSVTSAWLPPTDIFEDKDSIRIVAELPGVRPEDVKITCENNTLTIRGEKKQVAEEKTDRVHRYERTYGAFERSFSLPNTVDTDRVQASFEHGVLTVTLPKVERAKPREIPVKVNS
jgi:HSP20 family protein